MEILKHRFGTGTARVFLAAILCGMAGGPVRAQPQTESEVKAAYIYNFARFVEWPQRSGESPNAPIVIAIAGRTAFTDALRKHLQNQTLNGKPFIVEDLENVRGSSPIHILFIPASSSEEIPLLVDRFRGKETLTVSDYNKFLLEGGMVRFFIEQGKVRFSINKTAVDRTGLKISSQMLQYAKSVY